MKTYTSGLFAPHGITDSDKLATMVRTIRETGVPSWSDIEVRKIDDRSVIVDGVHRAVACCICNVSTGVVEVEQNEFLNDFDIINTNHLSVQSLANQYSYL